MQVVIYFNSDSGMTYSENIKFIRANFPQLDLLAETEFHLFKNESFALNCIDSCIKLCNTASQNLKICVNFAVEYNYTFNAKAIVKDNSGIILLNLGLIERLEIIVSDSIEVFYLDNISKLTFSQTDKLELKKLFFNLCISYLFHHELAHVLQLLSLSSENHFDFNEENSDKNQFKIKDHIYEMDADLFGITMCTAELLDYAKNITYPLNTILVFNLLTTLLFSISNIIIGFSKNQFTDIYYKKQSHPHPLIRIIKCNDQILSFTSKNLDIQKEFFLAVLQRTFKIINQIQYDAKDRIDFSRLLRDNILEIELYINEIEMESDKCKELLRFRVQKIFNSLHE